MPKGLYARQSLKDRFWSKVNIKSESECWEYIGWITKKGYGQFEINHKQEYAHRVAWTLVNGEIPDGVLICHTCDNPPCCNPSHLFKGTKKDNSDDMIIKGRAVHQQGESHGMAKLTEIDVITIRVLNQTGISAYRIAKIYGRGITTVSDIIHKRKWRHI